MFTRVGFILFITVSMLSMLMIGKVQIQASVLKYDLITSIIPPEGGRLSPSEGQYNYGEEVIITAYPNPSYRFDHWEEWGTHLGTSQFYSFTIDRDRHITAFFIPTSQASVIITAIPDIRINIADSGLETVMRQIIGKPFGDIRKSDIIGLTSLSIERMGIVNIEGLEHCSNLIHLNLEGNYIRDIEPISNLEKLSYLNLAHNEIEDLKPISNLLYLSYLNLWDNEVGDISPLSKLEKLRILRIDDNRIDDISPVENLTGLFELFMGKNLIKNISPLSNLTNLRYLNLWNNKIEDISAIRYLTKLTYLNLDGNQVIDIASLANLTSLDELDLNNNLISNISALNNNPGLNSGDIVKLKNNPLDEVSLNVIIPELIRKGIQIEGITSPEETEKPEAPPLSPLEITIGGIISLTIAFMVGRYYYLKQKYNISLKTYIKTLFKPYRIRSEKTG